MEILPMADNLELLDYMEVLDNMDLLEMMSVQTNNPALPRRVWNYGALIVKRSTSR